MTATTEKILVSIKEAAELLSVCPRTILNLIAAKQLPSRKAGRRRLVPRNALEQFARRDHSTRRSPAPEEQKHGRLD